MTTNLPVPIQYALPLALCAGGWLLGTRGLFLPWSADVALFSQVFMLVGDECRKRGVLGKRLGLSLVVVITALWVALALGGYQIELSTRTYPGGWVCIIPACLGSLLLTLCSARIDEILAERHNWFPTLLAWLGRYSMVILAIHCLRRQWANWSGGFKDFSATLP